MTNDDNSRTAARAGAQETDNARAEREAAAKAALDNMARLRALRLAREAAEPQRTTATKSKRTKTAGAKTAGAKSSTRKADDRSRPLSEWLAEQQSGGRRT
ncbi:MAG: hypothetical protein HZA66_18435 [Rhodopseudomonas palustris]|uniref:Uncharacterized protein n=1 Tax=Rhodopseudomonas palustris TaxID=1076 RepID=A0A933W2U0_RHOPL|nr:hypothetical protein [Rhodopseudomonas palustris]